MKSKKQIIVIQALLVAVFLTLTGCEIFQKKPEPEKPKAVSKPQTVIAKPQRVINAGLGLSFEVTPEQATEMGFVEVSGCKYKKISNDDPFWDLKEIHFTLLTCTVDKFKAIKYYKDEDAYAQEAECHEDKSLITDIIRDKYPTLVRVKHLPSSTRLCEGIDASSTGQQLEKGLGRCITLNCSYSEALTAHDLEVEYMDLDNFDKGIAEREEYLNSNRSSVLQKKNLDPAQF